jgi:hypothetical protein
MLQEQFDREEAQQQQQQRQRQQASQSGALTLNVTVPAGTQPGHMILVQAPNGQQVQVELPPHAVPGGTIQVAVPQQPLPSPEQHQQGVQPEPEPFGAAPPAAGDNDDDLARAIQASLANSAPQPPAPVPAPVDPFDAFADPQPAQPPQPLPPTATAGVTEAPSVGSSGAPLNNGAIELQLYCVDTTTSSSTLYVFAISRVGVEQPSHTVSKNYAEFVELNDALREELNAAASANTFLIGAAELAAALPPLPPKSTIGRRKAVVLAERQDALTKYLQTACAHPLLHNSFALSLFLAKPSDAEGGGAAAAPPPLPPIEAADLSAPSPPAGAAAAMAPAVTAPPPAAGGSGGGQFRHTATSVMVTLPPGAVAGQKLRVAGPSGHTIEMVVPEGALPGQQLQVQAQLPPPPAQQPPPPQPLQPLEQAASDPGPGGQQQQQHQHQQEAVSSLPQAEDVDGKVWSVTARPPHVDSAGHTMYPFAVTITTMTPAAAAAADERRRGGEDEEDDEEDDGEALQRSRPTTDSPWDDLQQQQGVATAAPPVRRMSLPGSGHGHQGGDGDGGGGGESPADASSPQSVEVHELCLRYSEWAALDTKLSNPYSTEQLYSASHDRITHRSGNVRPKVTILQSIRADPVIKAVLPELTMTSTVGRSKDKVMAERSAAVLAYLRALCALPTARAHPAFSTLLALESGRAEEQSRQQLLGRVDALEMELAERTMAMSAMEAENRRLSIALSEAEQRLAQVRKYY